MNEPCFYSVIRRSMSISQGKRLGWVAHVASVAGILLVVATVFRTVLDFRFLHWDDPITVTNNRLMTELGLGR